MNPAQKALYEVEYRTIGKEDGIVRWVAAKGRGIFDADGQCVRVLGTAIDITHRKQIETQLEASEAKLREADRRKDEFLATLAHELRNPLAPIRNASKLLQMPSLERQAVPQWAQMIERQAGIMASLLDDLLEVTRISTGKLTLKKRAITVGSLVEIAVETARPALDAKHHRFCQETHGADASIEVDDLRISQVLTNLLNNAAKYTDPGGDVLLRTTVLDDHVRFEVIDNGIGLERSDLECLFQMFGQADSGLGRTQGGLGIGLAVSKGLVELHGGTLTAQSKGRSLGSTFTVALPTGHPVHVRPLNHGDIGAVPSNGSVEHRILVVDDHADSADSLASLLEFEGYEVRTAYDGQEALNLVTSYAPTACFLDIGMPGMDGYTLAPLLRRLKGDGALLLIATTGWGQTQDKDRARDAGFDAHLTKPLDITLAKKLLGTLAGQN